MHKTQWRIQELLTLGGGGGNFVNGGGDGQKIIESVHAGSKG